MAKHRIEIDARLLKLASAAMGTKSVNDTVEKALQALAKRGPLEPQSRRPSHTAPKLRQRAQRRG